MGPLRNCPRPLRKLRRAAVIGLAKRERVARRPQQLARAWNARFCLARERGNRTRLEQPLH
eukprot:9426325-Lingulodinium_polyedra.AAC.1